MKIKISDRESNILFWDKGAKLNLSEDLIISRSVKWFKDPEPCFIHRSAVINRIIIELEDCINEHNNSMILGNAPNNIQETLSMYHASDIISIED